MKQSLLWKLSKKRHKDSYLLGTMHVKSESAFKRLEQIKDCIEACDLFAAEYNLDTLQSGQGSGNMFIPEEQNLIDLMGENKYNRSKDIFMKAFDVNLDLLRRFYPLIVVNVLSESTLTKDFNMPLDFFLWSFAKEQDLSLEGIESYESQLRIIRKIKMKDQIKMLTTIARNPSKFRKSILKMANGMSKNTVR